MLSDWFFIREQENQLFPDVLFHKSERQIDFYIPYLDKLFVWTYKTAYLSFPLFRKYVIEYDDLPGKSYDVPYNFGEFPSFIRFLFINFKG